MPRQRVDGAKHERSTDTSVAGVLAELRALGELRNPDATGYAELRSRAVRAFLRLLKDTRRGEKQATEMFEALRARPELIPPSAPGATPLPPRTRAAQRLGR
jgi:hypothetical protein